MSRDVPISSFFGSFGDESPAKRTRLSDTASSLGSSTSPSSASPAPRTPIDLTVDVQSVSTGYTGPSLGKGKEKDVKESPPTTPSTKAATVAKLKGGAQPDGQPTASYRNQPAL